MRVVNSFAGLVLGAALLVSACTSMTPYQAADSSGYGYAEQKIEAGRYRVSFRGNASTSRSDVENYLLYRMAQITRGEDYDYFIVIDQDTECDTTYWTSGDASCSLHRPHSGRFRYYALGYDCNPSSRTYESKEYEAFAFMSMHHGDKPEDNPQAFDARSVLANLAVTPAP